MQKFNFNIWDNSDSDDYELPLFLDTKNVFILNKENVDIITVVMIDIYTRLDSIIFEKYGGYTNIEQFNIIKKILPLVLLFNDFNDITLLKPNMFLKLPEINSLLDNLYIFDENDISVENSLSFDENINSNNLPGLNPINKYNYNNQKLIDNSNVTIGLPSIGLKLDKVIYDNEKGIVIY